MDWQNLGGWYIGRPPAETIPEGTILAGRETIAKGRYLLFIVGTDKVIILPNASRLSRLIDDINYTEKGAPKLSQVWVYLPDIAEGRDAIRCKVSNKAPDG